MGYFVHYHLPVLEAAYKKLERHVAERMAQRRIDSRYARLVCANQRQATLLGRWSREPDLMLTVKEVSHQFGIIPTTAKSDLVGLMGLGVVEEIQLNGVKCGYVKGPLFDAKVGDAC